MTTSEERLKEIDLYEKVKTIFGYTRAVPIENILPNDRTLIDTLVYFIESFLQDALREYKEEIRGKVDGMGFKDPNEAGQFSLHADGYNQAIEDILTLLEGDGK